jgi:hypothetical protein
LEAIQTVTQGENTREKLRCCCEQTPFTTMHNQVYHIFKRQN